MSTQRGGAFAASTLQSGCCVVSSTSSDVAYLELRIDVLEDIYNDLTSRVEALETTQAHVYIQDEQPTVENNYLWIQTGLGEDGCDFSFWIKS